MLAIAAGSSEAALGHIRHLVCGLAGCDPVKWDVDHSEMAQIGPEAAGDFAAQKAHVFDCRPALQGTAALGGTKPSAISPSAVAVENIVKCDRRRAAVAMQRDAAQRS